MKKTLYKYLGNMRRGRMAEPPPSAKCEVYIHSGEPCFYKIKNTLFFNDFYKNPESSHSKNSKNFYRKNF